MQRSSRSSGLLRRCTLFLSAHRLKSLALAFQVLPKEAKLPWYEGLAGVRGLVGESRGPDTRRSFVSPRRDVRDYRLPLGGSATSALESVHQNGNDIPSLFESVDDFTLEPVLLIRAALQAQATQDQYEIGRFADEVQKALIEPANLKFIYVQKHMLIELFFKLQLDERGDVATALPPVADERIVDFNVFPETVAAGRTKSCVLTVLRPAGIAFLEHARRNLTIPCGSCS